MRKRKERKKGQENSWSNRRCEVANIIGLAIVITPRNKHIF